MDNELIRREEAALIVADLLKGVQNLQQQLHASGGGGDPFLRLLKDGKYYFGAENIQVQPGSKWAINLRTAQCGWVKWSNDPDDSGPNKKLGEVLNPLMQGFPPLTSLPATHPEYEWKQQIVLHLACLTGEDKGQQVVYPCNSIGGINHIQKELMPTINRQLLAEGANPNPKIVPIVVMEQGAGYQHKKWGWVPTPKFNIVGWSGLFDTEVPDTKAPAQAVKADRPPVQEDDGTVPFEPAAAAAAPEGTRRRRR
jgi:hypothetical protein